MCLGIFVLFYYELYAALDVEFLIMFSILKKAFVEFIFTRTVLCMHSLH